MRAVLARRPPKHIAEYSSTKMNSILPERSFWELVVGTLKLELAMLMADNGSHVREDVDSDDRLLDVIPVGDDKPEIKTQLYSLVAWVVGWLGGVVVGRLDGTVPSLTDILMLKNA